MTYNDKSITFTGDLASYDYDSILRDKQRYVSSLYDLSDYFVDADPILNHLPGSPDPHFQRHDRRRAGIGIQLQKRKG